MTEPVIITTAAGATGVATGTMAVIAALDPSVTNILSVAIGGVVTITMGIIAYKTLSLNKRIDAQTEKIDQTLRKTEKIEGHVNSEKTKAEGEIAALQKENLLLREIMADKKETAALLAQSVATHPAAAVAAVATDGASETLIEIEKHTEATAKNTAATDVTVRDIKSNQ